MKIESAIKKAYFDLKQNNIKTALLDSEILMSKVLKKDRSNILLNSEKIISNEDYIYFRKLISSRLKNKPIAYLTGEKSFWKYEFDINDKVLIPRPETEELVSLIIKREKNRNSINIIDIGTGSGCIAISLRKNINSKVMGIDISSEAITVARKNILDESENVDLVNDSIEKFKTDRMFDVIVSNPPYIPISDKKLVDSLVLDNEPKTALFIQDDPLYFYRKILVFAKKNLNEGGRIYLEINDLYVNEVLDLFQGYNPESIRDFYGKNRFIICNMGK